LAYRGDTKTDQGYTGEVVHTYYVKREELGVKNLPHISVGLAAISSISIITLILLFILIPQKGKR
jgi:hypothetical protein